MVKGLGLTINGEEGMGKTSFAAQFPKPIDCFSAFESGMEDLIILGEVSDKYVTDHTCETYGELSVGVNRSKAATIIVDAWSGYQRLLFDHITQEMYGGDVDAFMDYYKGPRAHAPAYANKFLNTLENKRKQGTHILIISHATDDLVRNPRGLDYTTNGIDADKGIRDVLEKWSSNIIYMALDPDIDRVTKMVKKQATEAKMKEDDIRVMFTQKSMVHSAKNKLGLPPIIPMGSSAEEAYTNFTNHLPEIYKEILAD